MKRNQGPILITGVAGFIGSHVARYFSEQGWSVVGIDKTRVSDDLLANLSSYHSLILPDPAFGTLLQDINPQLCIHCAGTASVGQSIPDVNNDFNANTVITFETLNALRLYAANCSFIFTSSAAIYGNPESLPISETLPPEPISPYGFHKLQCELLCKEFSTVYGLRTTIVRIFSAYGTGLRRQVIWDICEKAISQGSINLHGTGKESRDFIHVIDIAKAIMAIANFSPMQGDVFNIASGRETRIDELANIVVNALDCECPVQFNGIVPPGTPLNWRADISKAMALGFTPSISLEEGVNRVVELCRSEVEGI